MTNSTMVRRDAMLAEVAERLRQDGYTIIIEPDSSNLPFDLRGYRPDLLARKGQDNLIVEVKNRADRLSVDMLRSVAEEVRLHPGWRFVLITAQDIPDIGLPSETQDQITWDDIAERLEHARRLHGQGENEASYLVLWIAFERLLRLQAQLIALPVDRLLPSIVIRQLYSQGELSIEQFDAALACQNTRNRLVHGLPSPDLPTAIEQLLKLVPELLHSWSAESSKI